MSSLLKQLAPFEGLTSAEAAVFEADLSERAFKRGERLSEDEALLVLREGTVGMSVNASRGRLGFAAVGAGGLLGELTLFEPEPVAVDAEAETEGLCYTFERRALRRSFQYSRTGAAKFMMIAAGGLSKKLRSAIEILNQGGTAHLASGGTPPSLRPSPLAAVDRDRLKGLSASRSVTEGSVIFREGMPGTELFVIGEGEVEIVKETSGGSLSLARLGPGDFFGEMAFVDRGPRSASAIARTAVELSVLPADTLERVVEFNVGTALYLGNVICKIVARRLNATLIRIASL